MRADHAVFRKRPLLEKESHGLSSTAAPWIEKRLDWMPAGKQAIYRYDVLGARMPTRQQRRGRATRQ